MIAASVADDVVAFVENCILAAALLGMAGVGAVSAYRTEAKPSVVRLLRANLLVVASCSVFVLLAAHHVLLALGTRGIGTIHASIGVDGLTVAALVWYWIRLAHAWSNLPRAVSVLSHAEAVGHDQALAQVLRAQADLEAARAVFIAEQMERIVSPLRILRQYRDELRQGEITAQQFAQAISVLSDRMGAVDEVLEAIRAHTTLPQ